ncbi:MAG: hypothetical protein H0W42_03505 [Gemmatimonadaceae bacterium]|nr:hypothetical protein [Gemmatimonadaceae bacterium]
MGHAYIPITAERRWRENADSACTARALSRAELIVEGGRALYVEPVVFVTSGDRVLLAGKPSYLFAPVPGGATFDALSRNVVFGAVISPDGSARTVPSPDVNAGKVAAIAGAAAGEGAWRLIFAELDSMATDGLQTVGAFWHGIYDGERWSSVERLPPPPDNDLFYYNSSRLAENGDTIVWAARTNMPPRNLGVVVYERTPAGWSYRVAGPSGVAYVQVAHSRTLGFTLALVYPDPALYEDTNSLFFYRRRSDWELVRKVVAGGEGAIHRPLLNLWGDSGVLTWKTYIRDQAGTRIEFRGMVGEIGQRNERLLVIDGRNAEGRSTLITHDGRILWVTDHVTGSGGERELQLRQPAGDSTAVLWRTPYPYRGPLAATVYSHSDLMTVGPKLDEARQLLVSVVLRLRLDCGQNSKPGR